ncbi:MAG TPA: hypothetical protein VH134_12490 [Candidatus Dormibacteraeota bacterium]|nr:hypothetical protein [Candidatus Dormibacteraeota bacterium]
MISHIAVTDRSRRLPDCPLCRGPVEMSSLEAVLSTNRGYRFPMLLVQCCPACDQAVAVELAFLERWCDCDAYLETDLADHAPVPQAHQLVSVVFESCSACGQVREAYLNH